VRRYLRAVSERRYSSAEQELLLLRAVAWAPSSSPDPFVAPPPAAGRYLKLVSQSTGLVAWALCPLGATVVSLREALLDDGALLHRLLFPAGFFEGGGDIGGGFHVLLRCGSATSTASALPDAYCLDRLADFRAELHLRLVLIF
jgi:hypothetical protein